MTPLFYLTIGFMLGMLTTYFLDLMESAVRHRGHQPKKKH